MSACCTPAGYGRFFNDREAQKNLRAYRAKGLDRIARRLVDYLAAGDTAGSTVLEVGGGIGALHIELLKAGAARAVNVEISPGYEAAARTLLDEEGFGDRVEREVMDFADHAGDVAAADVVVLNRVVCCYPDMEKLMGAALGRTKRYLGVSFPLDRWYVRGGIGFMNRIVRLRGIEFQAYVHPPEEIVATVEQRGFRVAFDEHGLMWRAVVFEKTT